MKGRLLRSGGIPLMGGQHRASPQEGWKKRAQRITSPYPTSTCWWIILLNTLVIPSWTDSPDITKSRWPSRTRRKPISSPHRERSVIRSCHSDSKMPGQPIRGPWSPSSTT
ncbi:hypothetical protein CR513_15436, partial [Mucuna pruriens]